MGEFPQKGLLAIVALGFSLVTVAALAGAAFIYRSIGPTVDFTSFWAAGHVALGGHAAHAYEFASHAAIEKTVTHSGSAVPFLYPPPFLLVVIPIGFQPYWLAYLLWVLGTGALYIAGTRRILPARFAIGYPAGFDNVAFGQNAFLTCSAFAVGTALLDSQPFTAGAVLGLFVCKPQLACLLPVALLAGRRWSAIIGAFASSIALLCLAGLLFGFHSYADFLAASSEYGAMMAHSEWRWNQVASVFGMVRYFGASPSTAFLLQGLCAALAFVVTWRAWALKLDERVPILVSGTLLVSPYLFTYDSLLLAIVVGWFLRERKLARVALVWLLSLATVLSVFGLCPTPNLTPVAAMLSLWWLTETGRKIAIDRISGRLGAPLRPAVNPR